MPDRKTDKTEMGGPRESFHTTHWSEILDAQTLDPNRGREVVGTIVGQYWKPVYCYLRRKGKSNEKAKDLTQGFFTEVVLGRELILRADQAKGKFRTLLLTALDRYVTSIYRSETAKKRMPARGLVSLDGLESPNLQEPSHGTAPDEAFVYAWASEILDEVLTAVEAACRRVGQHKHWEVFRKTVLEPILAGTDTPPLSRVCDELDIESKSSASNMNVTVKRRFRNILQACVRQFVGSDDEVAGEIVDLMQILSKNRAGK